MPRQSETDPRPLTGEPLSVDLLNTRWKDAGGAHDLLESTGGLARWLDGSPLRKALGDRTVSVGGSTGDGDGAVTADRATLDRLLLARTGLASLIDAPAPWEPGLADTLNSVLDRGRLRRLLPPDGEPRTEVEVDAASWLPAWLAAEDFLRLLADRPERIRGCTNEDCVLHFYDVSKNGTRRWCSMAGCGNRAKALRHYARHG
ncbi:CGNR zinc finger domain-containing protein [Streptomyces sp. N2-109]|uniref:CGNR zinc finger domain-containing protein n=1 Tax=Streptomyces gossypii TaxID=2883101 RepID=A0ABT2JQD9_9ACTN|nr:CGNR zinc finger domain-containing protein [Streptomyces gossypii]MCT2589961.1 CGNR zinc finger domain-containing protein [Streptomyces gossypii]